MSVRARSRVVEAETTSTFDAPPPPEAVLRFDFQDAAQKPAPAPKPGSRAKLRASARDTSIKDAIIKWLKQQV